jgi:hypothetical protein
MKNIILIVATLVTNQLFSQACFSSSVEFGDRIGPIAVRCADLNYDNNLDVIVANNNGASLSIFLGDGSGEFTSETNYSLGGYPVSIAISDFNSDSIFDIVTANASSNKITILMGNNQGTYDSPVDVPVGLYPYSVINEDFNGDNKQDLAVANSNENTVSILLGTGTGSFETALVYDVDDTPICLISSDLNSDGKPDIITANRGSNNVSVLLGNGDGTFGEQNKFSTEEGTFSLTSADFNGDSIPDIATANYYSNNKVSVLLGIGNGEFSPVTNYTISGYNPQSIISADFNKDGNIDLATSNSSSNSVSVLLGTGNGGFYLSTENEFAVGGWPYCSASGDFNGDSLIDIVTSNNTTGNVSILLNCKSFVGLPNLYKSKEIDVYPNPSKGQLYINYSQANEHKISVFDANGRMIINKQHIYLTNHIDLSYLDDGVYYLSIESEKDIFNEKIIIMR